MLDDMHSMVDAGHESSIEAGPLVQAHIVVGRTLWRIGPAWSVLAGALAAGVPLTTSDTLLRLAAAVVLADLAWGTLRKFIPAQPARVEARVAALPSAPYAHPAAPLTRFLQALTAGHSEGAVASGMAWQSLLAGLVLTAALSLLLGRAALILSAVAIGVTWLAWALARRGNRPAFGLALLDVALPWGVGSLLAWRGPGALAGLGPAALLAMAFTVLQWGSHRARLADGLRFGGLWLGQASVLVGLAVLHQPWALAVTATLFAPPTWWLARRAGASGALVLSMPWWWAAMLFAAAAVRW
jgi:hypothetical protein